jgi:tetratricopeptide (TPR) repeat protein
MRLFLALTLCVAAVPPASGATPPEYEEGKKLYKAGEHARALEKLAAAARKAPGEARVHYLLGLAQAKLGRFLEAERSLLEAQRLDPSIRFTSRSKFEEKLKRVRRLAARMAPPAAPGAPAPGSPPIVAAPAASTPFAAVPVADLRRPAAPAGAPLWAYILLGVSGAVLVVSFVRGRLYPAE